MKEERDGEPEGDLDRERDRGEIARIRERREEAAVAEQESVIRQANESIFVKDEDHAAEAEPHGERDRTESDDEQDHRARGDEEVTVGRALPHPRTPMMWSVSLCARASASAGERNPETAAESSLWSTSVTIA